MKWIELLWLILERLGKTRAVVYNLKVSSDQTIVER
jgi:hypothetical protein